MAYCGYQDLVWSKQRCAGFLQYLANKPVNTFVFEPGKKFSPKNESQEIANWLRSLPAQVGLFACNDDRGEEIVELCKLQEIRVPEQIAVLGMDNDEITCSLCVPQLSSIEMDTVNAGFKAAKLLDRLMAGEEENQSQQILDKATKVITRESTETKPINDPLVAEAVWFIRQNIRNKINAKDVIENSGITRNTLYACFKKALGKSIYETIQDEKIKYISRMLLQTDMTVSQIAIQFGENDDKNISRIFRRKTGFPPKRFRELNLRNKYE